MNPLIELKTATPLILLALVCFGLLPKTQAVIPPPDGGYPGGNTAEGTNALFNLTSGINNTAVGAGALQDNTTGGYNVAIGEAALASNTTGSFNMAVGTEALRDNTANFNSAIGFRVLFNNTTGRHLTGIGAAALQNNSTASFNTAIGAAALQDNDTGEENTAIGADALAQNNMDDNTAIGAFALSSNTTGGHNTATGAGALNSNTESDDNTAVGFQALQKNTASNNTAMGAGALHLSEAGGNNTAVGFNALGSEVTGISNVAVGSGALANAIHGFNIAVGADAGSGVTTAIGVIAIGSSGANVGGSCFIGNIRGVTTNNADAIPVVIDSFGQLGTLSSSQRFKKDIKPMEGTSSSVLDLKPVTFHYRSDKSSTPQFGLIAEEVAKVNPDLVVHDKDGQIYTVRYDAVNAMLLNEFLKEHRKNQEQEAIIAKQQKQIDALAAGLQKVSAQLAAASPSGGGLEASKPAPQVVNNQ
jgi:trimeric autotransporter adhesin